MNYSAISFFSQCQVPAMLGSWFLGIERERQTWRRNINLLLFVIYCTKIPVTSHYWFSVFRVSMKYLREVLVLEISTCLRERSASNIAECGGLFFVRVKQFFCGGKKRTQSLDLRMVFYYGSCWKSASLTFIFIRVYSLRFQQWLSSLHDCVESPIDCNVWSWYSYKPTSPRQTFHDTSHVNLKLYLKWYYTHAILY